ncbi:hypothetical protein N7E02_15580 [Aliirhizobium terrae]|uniref:hypothetical protein n=1 Tax=Terrirhizobium terrae TaxID=2926709 RepID=UPI002576F1F7|nr:hypothetical protein [Rhizobium sp. CC-CFT758]WJH41707.1 hypothetical protein N7E02_15580 [Rhizobium sp. CC-CFT758]
MPRYVFYSCSKSGAVLELGGKQLPGLEAAKAEAKTHIRKIMADAIAYGRDISRRKMEILYPNPSIAGIHALQGCGRSRRLAAENLGDAYMSGG